MTVPPRIPGPNAFPTAGEPVLSYAGRATRTSAAQSINNATWMVATFASQDFDTTGDIWDSTASERLVVPKDGLYSVRAEVQFDAHSTGVRWLALVLNGTVDNATGDVTAGATLISTFALNAVTGAATRLQASADLDLLDGDYLTANVRQSSGAALNLTRSFLSLIRLGSLP